MSTIEYRVKPVTRYIVTRYTEDSGPGPGISRGCGSELIGEFPSGTAADVVADAMVTADLAAGMSSSRSRHGLTLGEVISGKRIESA